MSLAAQAEAYERGWAIASLVSSTDLNVSYVTIKTR